MFGNNAFGEYAFGEQGGTSAPVTDTTAPTLTSPSGTATGSSTATGAVTTNEASGFLYYLATTSATATLPQVMAGGSKAVTAAGAQAVAFASLTAATAYYPHYVHVDAAGNISAVSNGASFTTAAAPVTLATTVSFSVVDATGAAVTGLVSLDYAFFDQPRLNAGQAPVKFGSTISVTNGQGSISIAGVTSLAPGGIGLLVFGDSALAKVAIGRVTVS